MASYSCNSWKSNENQTQSAVVEVAKLESLLGHVTAANKELAFNIWNADLWVEKPGYLDISRHIFTFLLDFETIGAIASSV